MTALECLEFCLKHGINMRIVDWMAEYSLTSREASDILYTWLANHEIVR